MTLAVVLGRFIELCFVLVLVAACITVLSTLFRGGGPHDLDIRGPRRRFPK